MNDKPLVQVPALNGSEPHLAFTAAETKWLAEWVLKTKKAETDRFLSAIHSWRLACFSSDLAVSGDIYVNPEGKTKHRAVWDGPTFCGGPIFRWLSTTFMPILKTPVKGGPPNKAVIFAPLPGQTYLLVWWLRAFYPEVEAYHFLSLLSQKERQTTIDQFDATKKPSVLILTPAVGGTGLNLVAANHVVILQKFWNLNEQRQAVARIHRLGQMRTAPAWVLHCVGGIDNRA